MEINGIGSSALLQVMFQYLNFIIQFLQKVDASEGIGVELSRIGSDPFECLMMLVKFHFQKRFLKHFHKHFHKRIFYVI